MENIKNCGIFGAGFGLYGYAAALAKLGVNLWLPEGAKAVCEARGDLAGVKKCARFANIDEILGRVDSAVLALPPLAQNEWLQNERRILGRKNIKNLFLEKPLCPTPAQAQALEPRLFGGANDGEKKIRIGYLMIYCAWFEALERAAQKGGETTLKWHFLAHHYRHNLATWKRVSALGGEAVRFYGIHIFALAAKLGLGLVGIRVVVAEGGEIRAFEARFAGENCSFCANLDCAAEGEIFEISHDGVVIFSAPSPFEAPKNGADSRLLLLKKHIESLALEDEKFYAWYRATNALWRAAEARI